MSVKFQFSKLIMEKFLRRSFYDAVLRLYETAHGARIISVSLEGHLSLVVNKNENFVIKLNEIAQRADDGEDPNLNRLAKFINLKPDENTEGYFIKSENASPPVALVQTSSDCSEVVVNLDDHVNEEKNLTTNLQVMSNETQYVNSNQRLDYLPSQEVSNFKTNEHDEGIDYKQPNNELTESQANFLGNQSVNSQDGRTAHETIGLKTDQDTSAEEEICFLPVTQEDSEKRKLEFDFQGQQNAEKKSTQKRRKLSAHTDFSDMSTLPSLKLEVKKKEEAPVSQASDLNANSLQLLPHTAIAPIIVEDEDSNYTASMETPDSQPQTQQQALGAVFQLRDQMRSSGVACSSGMGMFRQQDLEELARQQQQWQMVAYQRSIMEKSYLQQQLLRDSERLRWEFTSQQVRDDRMTSQTSLSSQQLPGPREFLPSGSSMPVVDAETAEKLYRQAQANTEAALLAAATLEQVKKNAQEGQNLVENSACGDKLSTPHYIRILEEHSAPAAAVSQAETEYEEGELRHDTHVCALCGIKFMALEPLIRHMEKHRVAFERSCSVCQSGTLTGNMLKLHMEASHGPETSFPMPSLPSIGVAAQPVITSSSGPLTSTVPEISQSFHANLQGGYPSSIQLDLTNMKIPQQAETSLKHIATSFNKEQEDMINDVPSNNPVKSEDPYQYQEENTQLSSRHDGEGSSSNPCSSQHEQEAYLGLASAQFYPLIACQVCGEKFALSDALDQHVESQHKDVGSCSYTCKTCTLSFDSHVKYSEHVIRHEASLQATSLASSTSTSPAAVVASAVASSATSSAQLKCSHCLKAFKSVKQLRLHYIAAHSCCHFCEYCRAGFPDAMSLQLHEQLHTLDPEKLSFRCDICSKAFYTQSQCSAHKRTHKDEKAHTCEVCGSSFFKRGDLTKHVRTVHSPSRLFACKFCGKKGTRMDNMRSHVRSHHKSMTRDQIVDMIEVIE